MSCVSDAGVVRTDDEAQVREGMCQYHIRSSFVGHELVDHERQERSPVLSGVCDDTPEIAFDMVGDWMDANTRQYLSLNTWKVLMMVWCGLTRRSRQSERACVRTYLIQDSLCWT